LDLDPTGLAMIGAGVIGTATIAIGKAPVSRGLCRICRPDRARPSSSIWLILRRNLSRKRGCPPQTSSLSGRHVFLVANITCEFGSPARDGGA